MQNQLQIFENREFGKIRVIEKDGQPWFVGKDITDVLAYQNNRDAVKVHVDDEDKAAVVIHDGRQKRKMIVINESGLYSLILSSKLPTAKTFKRWVTSEVLPSVRQHGAYITDDTLRRIREDNVFADELIQLLSDEKAKNNALLDHVEQLAPKARYYDIILQSKNAVPISMIAKDYGMSAVCFNKLLHALGIQYKMRGTWLLYQPFSQYGYTVSYTHPISEDKSVIHTQWTQKGRLFLYELLKECGIDPVCESCDDSG